ncbi:MAG TPA: HNH endonuclease signature motif containing protein [Chloroflexota bacterium]|nr:HNH endonuclease signature motif containing protein [Chloroflexota bacterium]
MHADYAIRQFSSTCSAYTSGISTGATLVPHEPDHILGEQHGGTTALENLAYACLRCNRLKGPHIATRFSPPLPSGKPFVESG